MTETITISGGYQPVQSPELPRASKSHFWRTSTLILVFFIGIAVGTVFGYYLVIWTFEHYAVNDKISLKESQKYATVY